MVKLPNAPQAIRCVYSGTYGGAKWANVFALRYTGGPATSADLNSLAQALRNAWNTNLAPLHSTLVSLTNTTVQDLTTRVSPSGTNATSAAGTNAGTVAMPANVALVLSMKISRRYRGGHPRMYLSGQTTGNTTVNTSWTPAWTTTCTTNSNAWLTAINALTYASMTTIRLSNLSYYTDHTLRPEGILDDITSIVVHSRVDTQRRRLGKEIA